MGGGMLSITLHANYQPCSTDLCEMMVCAEVMRRITNGMYPCADIQLYRRSEVVEERPIQDEDLQVALTKQRENVKAWTLKPNPMYEIRLFLSHHDNVSDDFITRLSVDFINWESLAIYVPGKNRQSIASSSYLTLQGASFNAALAYSRTVSPLPTNSVKKLIRLFSSALRTTPIPVWPPCSYEHRSGNPYPWIKHEGSHKPWSKVTSPPSPS
jgi:hypothetical protein